MTMSKIGWLILNSVSLLGALFVNYWVNSSASEGESIGEISDKYSTLITPADYAFSIWGLIYLLLLIFVGFQWYQYLRKQPDQLSDIGIWFIVSNLANALWVLCWMNEYIDTSVIVMFLLLLSLIQLVSRLRLEIWDAPVRIIVAVWWPVTFYLGWIILASVVNVAAYLVSEGWDGGPFSEEIWTIVMLVVAMMIYIFLIYTRNMREAALVGIWGISSLAIHHWSSQSTIAWVSLGVCVVLLLASGYHGYKNRKTSPLEKWKRGEV